jgi:hypothetical protein
MPCREAEKATEIGHFDAGRRNELAINYGDDKDESTTILR